MESDNIYPVNAKILFFFTVFFFWMVIATDSNSLEGKVWKRYGRRKKSKHEI